MHLTGEQPHQILAQYDGWETAVRSLEPGDVIAHRVSIPIDETVPPGDYNLLLGLYSPQNARRLTMEKGQDSVLLVAVTLNS